MLTNLPPEILLHILTYVYNANDVYKILYNYDFFQLHTVCNKLNDIINRYEHILYTLDDSYIFEHIFDILDRNNKINKKKINVSIIKMLTYKWENS